MLHIGRAIHQRLHERGHDIITAGRTTGDIRCDIADERQLASLWEQAGQLDAVVSAAGAVRYAPLNQLSSSDFLEAFTQKGLAQINLVRTGLAHIASRGSFTLTSGIPSRDPVISSAAAMGIVETLRLITDPGDAVVVCSPVYPPFCAFITHADRRVIEAPLGPYGRLDLNALDDAFNVARQVSERPVLLLCNPHNPTGVAHTRAELTAVAELALQHGARVISDEIHAPLVLAGAEFVPYLSVPGAENAFALFSASKGWNLAGLKAALLVAGPDATDDLARLPEEVSHGPSHLGILAHTAAFTHGQDWLDALLAGLDNNRRLLSDLIARHLPQVTMIRPEATYLAWLDCRGLGIPSSSSRPAPGWPAT